jgi:outer membrane protein OmpA-like peptidoglycan-associated protein
MLLSTSHRTLQTTSRFGYLIFLILFSANAGLSQISYISSTEPPSRLGVSGYYGTNISSTYIEEFSGQQFCGTFEEGAAPGLSLGIFGEIPLGKTNFSLVPSLSYRNLSSKFTTNPFNVEHAFDLTAGDTVRIDRERIYETNVSTVAFGAIAGWRPIERFRFDAGLSFGFFASHSYTKTEHLLTPDAVYTSNNLSTLELENGEMDVNSFLMALETGVGYDFPLSEKVMFTPRIAASFPLTAISTTGNSSYKTWTVAGGATLSVLLDNKKEVYIPPIPPELPTPPAEKPVVIKEPEKSVLRVNVRAVGISNTGEEVPEPIVSIQNVRVTDLAPTLNYIFFDDGESKVAPRYQKMTASSTKSFDLSMFNTENALEIHYHVLNILGKRLQQEPQAKITLTGTRSYHSPGDSTNEDNLALQRAESVANYLQTAWGISPSRIRIKSRGLPEQSSDDNTAAGQAENRRVEITTTYPKILDPLETRRIERIATPPRISFDPYIISDSGVKSVLITIKQGDKVIERIDAITDKRVKEQLWNIPSESLISGTSDSVLWTMDVVDSAGNTAHVSGSINIKLSESTLDVNKRDTSADKSLERYQLILFDYSKASSSLDNNVNTLLTRASSSVTQDARIYVIGYTDITGDPAYNDKLSLDRASSASLLLSSKLKSLGIRAPQFTLEGRGSRELLYDNTNAEGRFLSRTVRISIEKDLK